MKSKETVFSSSLKIRPGFFRENRRVCVYLTQFPNLIGSRMGDSCLTGSKYLFIWRLVRYRKRSDSL